MNYNVAAAFFAENPGNPGNVVVYVMVKET
jgi:hypothetical protein